MNQKLVLVASLLACLGAGKDRAPQKCHSILLTAELQAGDEFHRDIGGGLTLRLTYGDLRPNQNVNLWNIEIEPASMSSKKGPDYIYPVNPPLRFNPLQTLGATYGESAKALLSYPHEMRFLLSKDDYDKLSPKLDHAL